MNIQRKICLGCGIDKDLSGFYNSRNKCKTCCVNQRKKYYSENSKAIKEKAKEKQKEYRKNNLHISENYKKRKNLLKKERRKIDTVFKLKENIRSLIFYSFISKNKKKLVKTEEILGCTISEFKTYIEKQFLTWMTWENHGKYSLNHKTWQLDHIIPTSLAKNEEEIIKLNHYTNFQPLETIENIKKSNKH